MPDSPPDNLSFEQALAELELIVRDLEDGQVGLEESLARYEKGVGLLKRCYGQLRQAEQKIQFLAGVDEEGKIVARPFQHSATTEPERPVALAPKKRPPPRPEEPGLF